MAARRVHERANPAAPGTYSYSQVESALARVFGADAAGQAGWLRGRIQHLRRLRLTPPAGRGSVDYDFEWAARWLLALRLERVGADPAGIVAVFEGNCGPKEGPKVPV